MTGSATVVTIGVLLAKDQPFGGLRTVLKGRVPLQAINRGGRSRRLRGSAVILHAHKIEQLFVTEVGLGIYEQFVAFFRARLCPIPEVFLKLIAKIERLFA